MLFSAFCMQCFDSYSLAVGFVRMILELLHVAKVASQIHSYGLLKIVSPFVTDTKTIKCIIRDGSYIAQWLTPYMRCFPPTKIGGVGRLSILISRVESKEVGISLQRAPIIVPCIPGRLHYV